MAGWEIGRLELQARGISNHRGASMSFRILRSHAPRLDSPVFRNSKHKRVNNEHRSPR